MTNRVLHGRRVRGQQGFTLIEVLLTVAVVTAVMLPVLTWSVIALNESGDTNTTDDTTAFAQVNRFLTRDVATSELVSARQPGRPALPPATCGDQANPVWLRTTDGNLDVFYVTAPADGGTSELLRRQCRGTTLVDQTTVAEGLRNVQPAPRGTTTTAVPVQPTPLGVQCESRPGVSAASDPCGVVVLTLRGLAGSEVTLRAERRLSPDTSGDARPLPLITCDPESCRGFRGTDNRFTISFDASLSTAPRGIESYAWSFYDPQNPSVVLPTTGVAESIDPSTDPIQFPCSPEDTPLSWQTDAGLGNPGCEFEVQLTIREIGGGEYTATRRILIENAVPVVNVVPNPVEAFRVTPVEFSTAGTQDPDGGTLTYAWEFGDGTVNATPDSTEPNPTHTYQCRPPAPLPCTYVTVLRVSDGLNEVVREIPVSVNNAPPRIGISGPTAFTRLNETLTWRATDPDDPSNASAGPWDPDGNAARDGRTNFAPGQITWRLVRLDPSGESAQVLVPSATGATFNYTFTQFGRFLVTVSVTDVDGRTTETATEVRVNNPPIARAAIGKGVISATNPTTTSERVYNAANSPPDAPISLDSTRSFDPEGAPLLSRRWRVWQQGSTAPSSGVFPACNATASNLPCEINDTSTADAEGRQLFTPPTIDGWAAGRYRLVLVVIDDNLSENDCATVSPWSTCNQTVAGQWWVPLRINARPVVGPLTYASAPGSFRDCATPPLSWILCRTTSYTFSTTGTASDPDSSAPLTYEWVVPFGGGTVPGGPSLTNAFPATAAVPQSGTLQLRVTDGDGAVTIVSRVVSLRNHPPSTFILVDADPTGQQATGTWTTTNPAANPYRTVVSLTGGDPDGDIVFRSWTFQRRQLDASQNPVSPPESVTIEATRTGSTWTCTTTGSSPSMSFTQLADPPGCARIQTEITAHGRYRVLARERDATGDESTDTRDLLVLRPAVANIQVTSGGSNSCQINTGTPLPRIDNPDPQPDLVNLGNVTVAAPCLDARGSTEGNPDGVVNGYFWTLPTTISNPFRPWQLYTFNACANWVPGNALTGCYQFPVTLTVLNQANFPTSVTVIARFNARPVAFADRTPGLTPQIRTQRLANGNLITRIPACNGSVFQSFPTQACAVDLVGLGSPDPLSLSFDPDGTANRQGPSPVPSASYTWDVATAVPSVIDTSTPASRRRVTLTPPAGYSGPWGTASLRVTDNESYQSESRSISGAINRPPSVGFNSGDIFRVGRASQTLPFGQTAPVRVIVPEAADPTVTPSCSSLSDSTTTLWNRIPGQLPGEQAASVANYEWTLTQAGQPTIIVRGVSRVDCVFNATGGDSTGNTIVSSPNITFPYANGSTVNVSLRVTDSDGDSTTVSQNLVVRSVNPNVVIDPVTSAPANTPPRQTCQLRISPAATATSPSCSVWTDAPVQARTFTLDGAASTSGDGTPLSPTATYSWRLFTAPMTGSNVVGTDITGGCTANQPQFSCTLPATYGVYRAELTVTDGTRSSVGVYYLKLNQRPVVTLTPPASLNIGRNVSVPVTCSVSDPDSDIVQRRWELRNAADQVVVAENDPTGCAFTVPLSVPPGPLTFRYLTTDVEGATNPAALIAFNVANSRPTASVALVANAQSCAVGADPCVRNPDVGVDLSSTATDPDGSIASSIWTVRNPSNEIVTGLVADVADPAPFTLSTPGLWTFQLVVTDNDGESVTVTRLLRVNRAPVGPTSGEGDVLVNGELVLDTFATNAQAPFNINVAAANWVDEDTPLSYQWTLTGPADGPNPGPSLTATGATATFEVPIFGDYELSLRVTDSRGLFTTATREIRFNARPAASIEMLRDGVPCPGAPLGEGCVVNPPIDVEARGGGEDPDGTIVEYRWSLTTPAGTTTQISTSQDVDLSGLVDDAVGVYVVSLVVRDNNGLDSLPTEWIVFNNPPPTVSFDPGPLEVQRGVVSLIAANGVDPAPRSTSLEYRWRIIQDGAVVLEREIAPGPLDLELSPEQIDLGEATLEVTAFDADGGVSEPVSRTFTVVNAPPVIFVDTDPTNRTSSAASQVWNFISFAADPDGGTVAKYWWQVRNSNGDLVAGEATEPPGAGGPTSISFNFTVPDTYTATVFVRDDLGALNQASVQVVLNAPPTACVAALAGSPVATSPVLLDGSCSDPNDLGDTIEEYTWSATGPGTVTFDTTSAGATPATPLATFPVPGAYVVRLTVEDERGGISTERSVPVTVVAP